MFILRCELHLHPQGAHNGVNNVAMRKQKTVFICQQCGTESPKWMGKCSSCGEWNSMVETVISTRRMSDDIDTDRRSAKPQELSQIKSIHRARTQTKIEEFDRVLGGGIVPGSMVLVAGEPGIGKSTLMLTVAAALDKVLYVSGEESLEQIKIRTGRLGVRGKGMLFLAETDMDVIAEAIKNISVSDGQKKRTERKGADFRSSAPLVVIDSIQTLYTAQMTGNAGSVGQVRECTARLLKIAKFKGIPVFLTGHVTKAGAIAGPKVLEHMVDTVLYIEGERFGSARLLRVAKNRFGATDEVGVFEMTDRGMQEVANPSKLFLRQRVKKVPGSVVVVTLEGTRPVLAEIQALVVPTQLVVPRRIGQGVDYQRLQLIAAILSKRLGLPLATFDIFVNVTGGLQIKEPAADLGVALAILSSLKNIALDPRLACFGELGLLGELREVSQPEKRAKEARRLGFKIVISPAKFTSINQVAKKFIAKNS